MIKFLKKETSKIENQDVLINTASLLIHVAKIDENYTDDERLIIKKTLILLGANENNLDELLKISELNENKTNQILDFTKSIKKMDEKFKIKLIESLWKIIYSDKKSDIYEANLIRRLTGLLYLDNKIVGEIKEKIKKDLYK